MDLTKCTLDEFLAVAGQMQSPPAIPARDLLVPPGQGHKFRPLKSLDGYTIVLLNESGDVALIDDEGNEAGYYSGTTLIVHPEHQKKGLSVPLVLCAYEFRGQLPKKRDLTEGGKKALTAAWEVANGLRHSPWWSS